MSLLDQKLQKLTKLEQKVRDTVEDIKKEAKEQATAQVTYHLGNGDSQKAKQMIDFIEELQSITVEVNARPIREYVTTLIKRQADSNIGNTVSSGNQFQQKIEKGKIQHIMKSKGYRFAGTLDDKLKFEKDGEFYYAIEMDAASLDKEEVEDLLQEATKYCNLVLITNKEPAKNQLKRDIERWLQTVENREVLKKYITIQLGSVERLSHKGTILERVGAA